MRQIAFRIGKEVYRMANGKSAVPAHRLTVRMDEPDFERLEYWAKHEGYSINEFIVVMLEQYIGIANGNYQLPTLEVQRLNQLIESQAVMSRNLQSLESIVVSGFDSLLGLTRGDNYLLESDETGEV